MLSLIRQIWLVLLLSLVFGAALAFTDHGTATRISENRQFQIRQLAQRATLGELTYTDDGKVEFKIELKMLDSLRQQGLWAYEVVAIDADEPSPIGYALIAEGVGWDELAILIGLSADLTKITGLEILECRETPGLGERIKTDEFRDQYKKPTGTSLELVSQMPTQAHQVQAITGATISSEAVTTMVNGAVEKARELINPLQR